MNKVWKAYQRTLQLHPIRTGALSAGTLMAAGDVLAQTVIEKRLTTPGLKFDPKRTLRFMVFGIGFVGPTLGMWYRLLARLFGGTKFASVKMVACDQLLCAPLFMVAFLSGIKLLEGCSFDVIIQMLKENYKDVMLTNYKIWPAVQAINFTFVPVNSRVIVVNFVAVGWNTYLSWKSQHVTEPEGVDCSNSSLDGHPSRAVEITSTSRTVCEGRSETDTISKPNTYDSKG